MGKVILASFRWLGFGFLDPLVKLFQGVERKKNGTLFLKKAIIPIFSILLFLGVANFFSAYLYNIERERKIEKTRETLGEAAALEMQECIDSGDVSCKPNSLPSPADVWKAAQTLIADHKMISADKAAFKEKTAVINAQRRAQGLSTIRYTGRPSFVDQIFTSLETVFAGFLLAAFLAIPAGIVLGLSDTLRTALNWVIQIFKDLQTGIPRSVVAVGFNGCKNNPGNDRHGQILRHLLHQRWSLQYVGDFGQHLGWRVLG